MQNDPKDNAKGKEKLPVFARSVQLNQNYIK